jgi:hypothetical protein
MHFLRCFILAGFLCLPGARAHAEFFTPQQKEIIYPSLAGIAVSGVLATIPSMLAHWDIDALCRQVGIDQKGCYFLRSMQNGLVAGILLSLVGPLGGLLVAGISSQFCGEPGVQAGVTLGGLSFVIGYVVTVSMTLKLAVNWQDIEPMIPEIELFTHNGITRKPKKELHEAWIANTIILGLPYAAYALAILGWSGMKLKEAASHWLAGLADRAIEVQREAQMAQRAAPAADSARGTVVEITNQNDAH